MPTYETVPEGEVSGPMRLRARRGIGSLIAWQEWQGSAFARVHSRSLDCAETSANGAFERTGANGSERSLALAMQKVVGSSPIIRS